jgi:hypothetical protein
MKGLFGDLFERREPVNPGVVHHTSRRPYF